MRRWWVMAVLAVGTLLTTGLMLNGNLRYQVGVGRVSGFSVAETFSHRPLVFRLLSAAHAWLPEQASGLAGPDGSWDRLWVFEAGFRLTAAVLAGLAAWTLWRGLSTRWGSSAWPCAVAGYAALVFTAPATGEPDWLAALLTMAAVGAALCGRPWPGGSAAGVLLALAALVKISSLPVAVAGLVLIWALDHRRGWIAAASATGAGVLAIGLIWWLAPYEIGWLLDIRALQPSPIDADTAAVVGTYLVNLAARWPSVALLPAFFVGSPARQGWPALAAVVLLALGVGLQGQYFGYHAIPLVVLSAVLAVRTIQRSCGALRWPLVLLCGWTLVLFVLPADQRVGHPLRLTVLTMAVVIGLAGWQWLALRRQPALSRRRADLWAAVLVPLSLLATQTPFSAESLTLGTANRTPRGSEAALQREVAETAEVHALIGQRTHVAYLTFGEATYVLGNPTRCRYPSALFLQRPRTAERVSPANREENLACLAHPGVRWLVWDQTWLRPETAAPDLLAVIDRTFDCASGRVIGGYTLCPRRT